MKYHQMCNLAVKCVVERFGTQIAGEVKTSLNYFG